MSRLRSRSTTRRTRWAALGEKLRVPSRKTLRCCEPLVVQVEYMSARRERRRPGDAAVAVFSTGPSLSSSWCRPDGRGRVAARFTHHRAAPSRSRPAKDVTPWQCPWAFARSHRLRNRLRALRVTVTLYRQHQCRELVERSLGICGRPLESNGEPRSGLASAACARKGVRHLSQVVGLKRLPCYLLCSKEGTVYASAAAPS